MFGVKRAVIKMGRTQASEVAHTCICVEKGRALQGGVQRAGIRYDVRTRADSLQTLESLHLCRRSEKPPNASLNISSCKSEFKTMGVSQSQEMVHIVERSKVLVPPHSTSPLHSEFVQARLEP